MNLVPFREFLVKQLTKPLFFARVIFTGVMLAFVYPETGVATVVALALVAIAFELTDISQRWNNEVNEYKRLNIQSHIVQITHVLETLVKSIKPRKDDKGDDSWKTNLN